MEKNQFMVKKAKCFLLFLLILVMSCIIGKFYFPYIIWLTDKPYSKQITILTSFWGIVGLLSFLIDVLYSKSRKKTPNYKFLLPLLFVPVCWLVGELVVSYYKIPRHSIYNGLYLKTYNYKTNSIGLLDKWGKVVVPCEYEYIYDILHFNDYNFELCFAACKDKNNKAIIQTFFEESENEEVIIPYMNKIDVELQLDSIYGITMEKYSNKDAINVTDFSYIEDARKALKLFSQVEQDIKEATKMSEIAREISYKETYYSDEDPELKAYLLKSERERFEDNKRVIMLFPNSLKEELNKAKTRYESGKYKSASSIAMYTHHLYEINATKLNDFVAKYSSNMEYESQMSTEEYNNQNTYTFNNYNTGYYFDDNNYEPPKIIQKINRTDCPNCDGGRRLYEKSNSSPSFSLELHFIRCSECGNSYDAKSTIHYHGRCNTCHGSGYLD